jgi:hypothetical protein
VHDRVTYITLDFSKEDHREYYNGFANRVLWPIPRLILRGRSARPALPSPWAVLAGIDSNDIFKYFLARRPPGNRKG